MSARPLSEFQKNIRQHLETDDVEGAIRVLKARLAAPERLDQLTMLSNRFFTAKSTFAIKGIIGEKEYLLEHRNVVNGLLELSTALVLSDLLPPEDQDPLFQFLQGLKLDAEKAGSSIFRVNCNRTAAFNAFNRSARERSDAALNFFIIQACTEQMPQSLAERAVLHTVERFDNDADTALHFRKIDDNRLYIPVLPVQEGDPVESLRQFKASFNRDYSHLRQNTAPGSRLALACQLPERLWDDSTAEYLENLLDWLENTARQEKSQYLFFLVVHVKGLHTPENLQKRQLWIKAQMDDLTGRHAGRVLPLPPLPVVERADVEKWFSKVLLDEQNDATFNRLFDLFADFIATFDPTASRYDQFDMRYVEKLQDMVYRIALQKLDAWRRGPLGT